MLEPVEIVLEKSPICLIRPPAAEMVRFITGSVTLPLGLAYIAAALEQASWPVTVIDAVGEGPTIRTRYYLGYSLGLRLPDIVKRIPANAGAVGINVMFTQDWPLVVRLVELIKSARPSLPIILGSEHVTAMPEFCLRTSKADYIVLGEGEETVVKLLEALEDRRPLELVDGIAYRHGNNVVVNRRRVRKADVDSIPSPAWHHFKVRTYDEHRFVGGMNTLFMTMPLLATRGCPFQCTFCASAKMWAPRWIPRSPKLVVDEIEHNMRQYGARNFTFHDLTAIVQKDWIIAFCQEILDRGLDFTWQLPSGTRSEAVDAEVAKLLKKSGMLSISYAPESGSDTTRRLIKKKMKTQNLIKSIDATVEAGLNVSIFLIIGFPHDLPEHLEENLPFIDRMVEHRVTTMSVGYFVPVPGTELFDSLYDAGKIRLDREYFRNILGSTSIIPYESNCDALSKWKLTRWKWQFYSRFYGKKGLERNKLGLIGSILWGVSQIFKSGEHESKVQTVLQRVLERAWGSFVSSFGPRWIPRKDEDLMFAGWDEIFRSIYQQKITQGVIVPAPADTSELYRRNVISVYAQEHTGSHSIGTETGLEGVR